jgi:hypothetical protein
MNKSLHRPSYKESLSGCQRANAELQMCEKCIELDKKIARYERILSAITDQIALDGIKELIKQMKAQKIALHPEG